MVKYKVVSDSMEPLIPVGSELIIDKDATGGLKRFDIIVFEEGHKLICHYVWHINHKYDRGHIQTRSLKTGEMDVGFSPEKVVGKVINFRIPFFLRLKILMRWT